MKNLTESEKLQAKKSRFRGLAVGMIVFIILLYILYGTGEMHKSYSEMKTENNWFALAVMTFALGPTLAAFFSSIVATLVSGKRLTRLFIGAMGIFVFSALVFVLSMLVMIFPLETKTAIASTEESVEKTVASVDTIIAPSGSIWIGESTEEKATKRYYHIVGYNESLEFIFNDMETSMEVAKEQGYGIGVRKDGKYQDVSLGKVLELYESGVYLYSNLEPGDRVYLTKDQLDAMKTHRE